MKTLWMAALAVAFAATSLPFDAEAARLGGGRSGGMQRSMPSNAAPQGIPAKQAPTAAQNAPAAAPGAAAAATPKRNWMGPLAGLAAGLGLAALMSHLGMGEGFANMIMIALLAVAAFAVIRLLMARFGGGAQRTPQTSPAMGYAGGTTPASTWQTPPQAPDAMTRQAMQPELSNSYGAATGTAAAGATAATATAGLGAAAAGAAATPTTHIPEGFDTEAFQRIAKQIFIRLQAANDVADLDDLRNFTTPEMYSVVRLDLQERGGVAQRTDVVRVDAAVLDVADEGQRQIVSVRFHGLIREQAEAAAADFDEIWHLVRPEGQSSWLIAGIQQRS